MNDQNVKKISSKPPDLEKPEQTKSPPDSFKLATKDADKPEIGPGDSKYKAADPHTSQWKLMSNGAKNTVIGGIPDENILEALVPWCEKINQLADGDIQEYISPFRPRTAFDFYRLKYETPDLTRQIDLKKTLPPIYSFAEMYQEVPDVDYIKTYFTNRLGLIKDLVKHTEDILAKELNPHILMARKEFHIYLLEKKAFVEKELAKAYMKEVVQPTDDD